MIKIILLTSVTDLAQKESLIEQVKFIFYASSSLKEFSSQERKDAFFKRWCGDYLSLFPDSFYLMIEDEKVLGYLSGCINSLSAEEHLEVPGFRVFHDLFDRFPAHFHINFHPDCRGRGLGSQLVERYCHDLSFLGVKGVHLVTSPGAANISFYHRCHFSFEMPRDFNQMTLLFMGKCLTETL